jgi:hypothetical protein
MSADQIPVKLKERLEQITVANGFNTNAGQNVMMGQVIDPENDQLPALTVIEPPADDFSVEAELNQTADELIWTWPLLVFGALEIQDPTSPLPELAQLSSDIVKAAYDPTPKGRTLGGLAVDMRPVSIKHLMPESGSKSGAAIVLFEVKYTEVYS